MALLNLNQTVDIEEQNWDKASKVFRLARDGLKMFVEKGLLAIQALILAKVCGNGSCCHINSTAPCLNIDQFEVELMGYHRYRSQKLRAKNKNRKHKKWCCDAWEIGKFYMPLNDTYAKLFRRDDFDLNAMCNIIINCEFFRIKTSDFDQMGPGNRVGNRFTKLRGACNDIRHSGTHKLTSSDLQDLCTLVGAALTDPCELINDHTAQTAMKILMEIVAQTQTAPNWCSCANCQEMPTEKERQCCNLTPEGCLAVGPNFDRIVDKGVQAFAGRQRYMFISDQEKRAKYMRQEIYRQLSFQIHGRPLGRGKREPLPSCCIWAVRQRFPSPSNKYMGFSNK